MKPKACHATVLLLVLLTQCQLVTCQHNNRRSKNAASYKRNVGRRMAGHRVRRPYTLSSLPAEDTCNKDSENNKRYNLSPCYSGFHDLDHSDILGDDGKLFKKCAHYSEDINNFEDAVEACKIKSKSLNTAIAIPRSKNESQRIRQIAAKIVKKQTNYWIGIRLNSTYMTNPVECPKKHLDICITGCWQYADNSSHVSDENVDWSTNASGHFNNPNQCERQKCVMLWYSSNWKWDSYTCEDRLRYICTYSYDWSIQSNFIFKYLLDEKLQPIVGDPLLVSCTIKAPKIDKMFVELKSMSDKKLLMRYSINGWGDSVTRDSIDSSYSDYFSKYDLTCGRVIQGTFHKKEKCVSECTFNIILFAHRDKFELNCGLPKVTNLQNRKTLTYDGSSLQVGRFDTEFTSDIAFMADGKPNVGISCLVRFGKDENAWATIEIDFPTNESDPEYVNISKKKRDTFRLSFYGKNSIQNKTDGILPQGFKLKKPEYGYSAKFGGWFVNISVIILENNTRDLHNTRFLCSSNTTANEQDEGGRDRGYIPHATKNFKVQYPPLQAELNVHWPDQPGKVWVGSTLTATCTAYVGSYDQQPAMKWIFGTTSWKNYFAVHKGLVNKVFLNENSPDVDSCKAPEFLSPHSGICYRIENKLLKSWSDAERHCKQKFGYHLATFSNKEHYKEVKANIQNEMYFIGFTSFITHGKYITVHGTEAWGSWSREKPISHSRDCGILTRSGVSIIDCHRELPFICQSRENYARSPRNFDYQKGHYIISNVSFMVLPEHNGHALQCASGLESQTLPPGITFEKLKSNSSAKLKVQVGPAIPSLSIKEWVFNASEIYMEVNCSAYVGLNGVAVLEIDDGSGFLRHWVVTGSKIESNTPTTEIEVSLVKDDTNKQIGRHLIINVVLDLTSSTWLHRSTITCFPFNVTQDEVNVTSYVNATSLKASHTINYFNLGNISYKDVLEEILKKRYGLKFDIEPAAKSAAAREAIDNSTFLSTFALIAAVLVPCCAVFMILMSDKDKEEKPSQVNEGESAKPVLKIPSEPQMEVKEVQADIAEPEHVAEPEDVSVDSQSGEDEV